MGSTITTAIEKDMKYKHPVESLIILITTVIAQATPLLKESVNESPAFS
jgi:hypothetical protein